MKTKCLLNDKQQPHLSQLHVSQPVSQVFYSAMSLNKPAGNSAKSESAFVLSRKPSWIVWNACEGEKLAALSWRYFVCTHSKGSKNFVSYISLQLETQHSLYLRREISNLLSKSCMVVIPSFALTITKFEPYSFTFTR